MQNVLYARGSHFSEMLHVRLIIEHRRAGKRPSLHFLIKVEVILITGKLVHALLLLPVLVESKGERRKPDMTFFDIIFI